MPESIAKDVEKRANKMKYVPGKKEPGDLGKKGVNDPVKKGIS